MPTTRHANRTRSPETWAKVRADYLGGMTAAEVCELYDIATTTFRDHARKNGWRLCDQDDPEPIDPEPDPEFADPDATPEHLAAVCWRRMTLALGMGRFVEAARWEKFHRVYQARVRELEAAADRARRRKQDALHGEITRLTDMVADIRRTDTRPKTTPGPAPHPHSSHSSHTLHGASDNTPPPDPDDPGIDRAERRRRMKLAMKRTGKGSR